MRPVIRKWQAHPHHWRIYFISSLTKQLEWIKCESWKETINRLRILYRNQQIQ